MITILKGESGGLESIHELAPGSWVSLVNPNPDEIKYVAQELRIAPDFLMAALDEDEKARTDREDGARLILWRIPCSQRLSSGDVPFDTVPFGVVLSGQVIVSICLEENEIFQGFLADRVPRWSTAERNRFLLLLLLRTAKWHLRYLRQIDREVDSLEDKLQLSMRNSELLELLKYQKSLIYFTTALRSNELMMERLRRSGELEKHPDDQDLLDDVLTENQQAIEMVDISSNILSQMMDAFASIISNNMNIVMKFLTSVTIILMLPTLVASFYGMNVKLPFGNAPYAFALTLVASFALSIVTVLVFLKKDWF